MIILRFYLSKDGKTIANQYLFGKKTKSWLCDSTKEAAMIIDKYLKHNWSKIDGIYIFRGPGGYSRIRSLHAFIQGLSLGCNIPITGYKFWEEKNQRKIPQNTKISLIYKK